MSVGILSLTFLRTTETYQGKRKGVMGAIMQLLLSEVKMDLLYHLFIVIEV